MNGPDDTTPPTSAPPTEVLPPDPPSIPDLPIPAGQAQSAMAKALDALAAAFATVEATSMACARALDATSSKVST